jgi:hypothetical protein
MFQIPFSSLVRYSSLRENADIHNHIAKEGNLSKMVTIQKGQNPSLLPAAANSLRDVWAFAGLARKCPHIS